MLSTDPPPAGRPWATALLPLLVGDAVLTFIAVWIEGQAVPAAILVGVVGTAATLQGGRSRKAGIRGLITTVWIILALTLLDTGVGPLEYSVAFAIAAADGDRRRQDLTGDPRAAGASATPSLAHTHAPRGTRWAR